MSAIVPMHELLTRDFTCQLHVFFFFLLRLSCVLYDPTVREQVVTPYWNAIHSALGLGWVFIWL